MSVDSVSQVTSPAALEAARTRLLIDALGLTSGKVVEAKVTAMLTDTMARLTFAAGALDVETPQPLPVGQTLTFGVERQGQSVKLTVTLPAGTSAQTPPSAATPAAAAPAPAARPVSTSAPPNAAGLVGAVIDIITREAGAAARGAVAMPTSGGPQDAATPSAATQAAVTTSASSARTGLPAAGSPQAATATPVTAPTGTSSPQTETLAQAATSSQAAARASTTPALSAAASAPIVTVAIAAQTVRTDAPATIVARAATDAKVVPGITGVQGVDPAAANGGFRPSDTAGQQRAATPSPGREAAPPADPDSALRDAVRVAASKQESLAPLFADLQAARTSASAAVARLPQPVADAIARVLGFALPATDAANGAALAKAVSGSGVFLEAHLAQAAPGAPLPADLKAALSDLKGALQSYLAETGAKEAPDGTVARPALHERPPVRGGSPHGQPPAAASIGPGTSEGQVAQTLLERTESALARITLAQAASTPDPRDAGRQDTPPPAIVEVPVRLGQDTAVMQFRFARERDPDGKAAGRPVDAPIWTVRFSMEAEPLGPIHAAVRWRDGRVSVQLNAERGEVAAKLDGARGELTDALEAAAFVVEGVSVASGKPVEPVTRSAN
ncbi:MAG: flagellar hook-length control protein FliK, partial [Alphaproteobacteria bacterium]